jgi:serine/threonine-protein kinase TTK/MPS1
VNGGGGVHNIPTTTVERLTQSEDSLRRSTSSILRSTKSAGTSILGPARRFKRRAYNELSPGDEIIYTSGIGGVEEPEHQSERHDEPPPANGTDQSQLHVIALKCHAVESGLQNLENPKMLSYKRNDMGNFVNLSSPSKSSSGHQRNPPDLPVGHERENDQPPTVFRNRKSINIHLDKHIHPGPGHKERQNATLGSTPPQCKALGVLGINNLHRPPPPPKMSVLEMATKAAGAATASSDRKRGYISQSTTMHTSA